MIENAVQPTGEEEILTPLEVCEKLKICRTTFQRRIKDGSIKVVRYQRKVYVLKSDLYRQLSMANATN